MHYLFTISLTSALILSAAAGSQVRGQLCEDTEEWTLEDSIPETRALHQLAKDLDGRIYVVGGQDSSGPTDTVFRLDESTGVWETIADMTEARTIVAAASDSLGRIYAIGGGDGVDILDTVERYDPDTDAWEELASLPEPRGYARAVANLAGDTIFLIGGTDDNGTFTDTVFSYDVSTDEWSEEEAMNFPRFYFGVAIGANDEIYAVGGEGVSGPPGPDDTGGTAEVRDPNTGEWTEIAALGSHPHQVGAVVSDECGYIYAIGGWNPGYTSAVERYDPETDTWSDCEALVGGRNNMAAIQGDSGLIYVIGGDASFSHVSRVETALGCTAPCEELDLDDEVDVKGQGFWKRVCSGAHPSGEDPATYVDFVNSYATFADVTDVDALCDRLLPDSKNDKCEKAEAQFMALLLNVASGRVASCNCVDDESLGESTVSEAIEYVDAILSDSDRSGTDCEIAQTIAEAINEGDSLVQCP